MHSGASWIKNSLGLTLSPLGIDVANLLGRVFRGIYHLNHRALSRVEWSNTYYLELILDRDLSIFDFDDLTALVVYAHDLMVRISITGCGPRYMRLRFHKRYKREGPMSERYPTMEDHIKFLREREDAN